MSDRSRATDKERRERLSLLVRQNGGQEKQAQVDERLRSHLGEPWPVGRWRRYSLKESDALVESIARVTERAYQPPENDWLTRYREVSEGNARDLLRAFLDGLRQETMAYLLLDTEHVGVVELPARCLVDLAFDFLDRDQLSPYAVAVAGSWGVDLQHGDEPATYEIDAWHITEQVPSG